MARSNSLRAQISDVIAVQVLGGGGGNVEIALRLHIPGDGSFRAVAVDGDRRRGAHHIGDSSRSRRCAGGAGAEIGAVFGMRLHVPAGDDLSG